MSPALPPPSMRDTAGATGADTAPPASRLAALDLFSSLDAADLARLARGARHRRLSPGASLWFAGEPARRFAVIQAGVVQIRQMTPTGEGVVIGLLRDGEAIGLAAALEGGVFPADAIAIGGPVELLWIGADALRDALAASVVM